MAEDLKQLKTLIYKNDQVEQLLEELGCHKIKLNKNHMTAALPSGDNPKGIDIQLDENLYTTLWTRGIKGDIFSLIGYILYNCVTFDSVKTQLFQIKTYICNVLDYPYQFSDQPKQQKKDWNYWLKEIKRKRFKHYEIEENKVLDERILNQYFRLPNKWWLDEGIDIDTQQEFEIGFDIESERITIPVRNKNGQLIGIKGRYIGKNQETLEHRKYNYLISCSKSIELYNLHRALPHIRQQKEVIVVEAAKSCMLAYSMGYKNVVSIEGDKLSPVQVKLLKELGLDISLIFGWDKGKDATFIKQQLKQIKGREVFAIYDTEGILNDKQSPMDLGKGVFDRLYQKKYKVK